jgi:two-component system, OmpR family, osmolarity sensor histidine kinase EnvZ
MKTLFNSLLLRLMLAQGLVLVLAFAAMLLMVGQSRGTAAARSIAPLWADAALRVLPQGAAVTATPPSAIAAWPGPPPPQAARVLARRYRVLMAELAGHGLPVREVRVSKAAGRETTWLDVAAPGAPAQWLGFEGGVFGVEEYTRRWPVIVFALTLIALVSGALTWTIVRPLSRLQQAVQRFSADGQWPAPDAGQRGPQALLSLERALADMAQERQRLEQDRTLMLAGISHDLRTPLARIRLHADLMPEDDPAVRDSKAAIQRNVQLADAHLAAFLDFAAPVAADEWRQVDITQLGHDAAALALPQPDSLQLQVAPGSGPLYTCPRLLLRVLATALDNAVTHGAAPIQASARRERGSDGHCWVLEVEDNGVGLPLSDRVRVLQPFERGEQARTRPGTGLGLALAQQIAARLGGRITLHQAQRGLIFRCELPDRRPAQA